MKRYTPLRRTAMKRRPRRHRIAPAALAYMGWVKTETPCRAPHAPGECLGGPIEYHHAGRTGKGTGRKCDDMEGFGLALKCHTALGHLSGPFKGWTKAMIHEWADGWIAVTRAQYAALQANEAVEAPF